MEWLCNIPRNCRVQTTGFQCRTASLLFPYYAQFGLEHGFYVKNKREIKNIRNKNLPKGRGQKKKRIFYDGVSKGR